MVQEEDQVAAAQAAVAEDGARVTDVAHQSPAQLVGQGLQLQALNTDKVHTSLG